MPGVRRGQGGGTPFLDRELRRGESQRKLMDLGKAAPQDVGGTNVRPNQPPSAKPAASPATPQKDVPLSLEQTPARPRNPQEAPASRLTSIPTVDDEFPVGDMPGKEGNVAATSLGERFYRRYGRFPTEVDLSIINLRRRFEKDTGRPPTRDELLASLRDTMVVNREDEFLG